MLEADVCEAEVGMRCWLISDLSQRQLAEVWEDDKRPQMTNLLYLSTNSTLPQYHHTRISPPQISFDHIIN
jgi:hypothetical protein